MARRPRWVTSALDFWSLHPVTDWAASLCLLVLGWFLPVSTSDLKPFLSGVASFGGIALAVEIFVCTMVYTASNDHLSMVRDKLWSRATRVTWMSVLSGTVVAAAMALLMLLYSDGYSRIATAIGATALGMTLVFFARALVWLRFVLLVEDMSERK